MKKAILGLLGACLLSAAAHAASYDGKQTELISASNQALIELIKLRDSNKLNPDSALAVIQEVLSPQFNFSLITRKALGKNWRKASDAERNEITMLFRRLLEKTYAAALSKFTNQQINYLPAEKLRDGSIKLVLQITDANKVVEIEYFLKEVDAVWEIDDVKIEKVSLLSNYRRQFNGLIRRRGFDGLIAQLRNR